jgi:hypothetical protein
MQRAQKVRIASWTMLDRNFPFHSSSVKPEIAVEKLHERAAVHALLLFLPGGLGVVKKVPDGFDNP